MPLNSEHEYCVDFIEGVEDAEKVPRVTVSSDREEIAKRRGDEGCELLFGEQF